MSKRGTAVQCRYVWERKPKGLRYVTARGYCKVQTCHPSRYCSKHSFMRPVPLTLQVQS